MQDVTTEPEPEPGAPAGPSTMIELLADLRDQGFERNMYVTSEGMVSCGACGHAAAPTELILHALRRLEGASDPGDEAAVLAVECRVCGARGTTIVRYGPEAGPADAAVLLAIEDRRPR
jgi:hypothetical protein